MKDRGRNRFPPSDLCGLIAHETAALEQRNSQSVVMEVRM